MGPLFFNLFFNDLFYHIKRTRLNAHAGDHQIYVSKVDPVALEDCISGEVNVENQWYGNNGMILNETKHQAMVLGKTEHKFSFPLKHSIDIFGMNVDNKLSFDNHIFTVCRKINKQFNVMLRFRIVIFRDTLLESYNDFILPHFNYCSSV